MFEVNGGALVKHYQHPERTRYNEEMIICKHSPRIPYCRFLFTRRNLNRYRQICCFPEVATLRLWKKQHNSDFMGNPGFFEFLPELAIVLDFCAFEDFLGPHHVLTALAQANMRQHYPFYMQFIFILIIIFISFPFFIFLCCGQTFPGIPMEQRKYNNPRNY